MKIADATAALAAWSAKGKNVYLISEVAVLFRHDRPAAFNEGLRRLVRAGILIRAANGIYVYGYHNLDRESLLHQVTSAFRPQDQTYISLESALSQYGLISQMPIDRITVMTSGRKGMLRTPWGTVELTHTSRSLESIVDGTLEMDGPLRLARPETALRDLRRSGRNQHMILEDEIPEVLASFAERDHG